MTYFIAVANQKGGVAKTTTTASLGGALAKQGREVLLIDLDPQANLTMALGMDSAKVRHSIADVLFNWATLLSVSRETSVPGLDLVPSNSQMELAERFLPVRKNFEYILRNAMNGQFTYEFIIFDCPPSIGAVTLNALNAANLMIIPTLPEYFAARGLRNMILMYRRVRERSNPDLTYRILITVQDRRNRVHRELSDQMRDNFATRVFKNVIQVDTKLRESPVVGLPITHYSPKSRAALQYAALARELIQYVEESLRQPV